MQTGSRARKYKVDDQGNTFIDYGKIESNQPMWDAKPPAKEKADGSEYSDISRPWDEWDEWEHRSALSASQSSHLQSSSLNCLLKFMIICLFNPQNMTVMSSSREQ